MCDAFTFNTHKMCTNRLDSVKRKENESKLTSFSFFFIANNFPVFFMTLFNGW